MGNHTVIRYHDFCAGHTVTGHESKCAHLHGHNYRVHLHVQFDPSACPLCDGTGYYLNVKDTICGCQQKLDNVGRVVDFSVVKDTLCQWIEDNWDHKFLINVEDPRIMGLGEVDPESLVICDFNPTAENMAKHLVEVVAPLVFKTLNIELIGVELSETRKCSVTYFKD